MRRVPAAEEKADRVRSRNRLTRRTEPALAHENDARNGRNVESQFTEGNAAMTLHELAADYFAKQDAYRKLSAEPTPTDLTARTVHQFAVDDALDAAVEASLKLTAARKAEEALQVAAE